MSEPILYAEMTTEDLSAAHEVCGEFLSENDISRYAYPVDDAIAVARTEFEAISREVEARRATAVEVAEAEVVEDDIPF